MTQQLSYFCRVSDDGALQGLARTKLKKELRKCFAGSSIEILIHKKKKHRSVNQNRYYWLIVSMLSDHTGFTRPELHAILKKKFLSTEKVYEGSGLMYEYVRSTTELTTIEFEEYLESVRRFASEEFQMVLPLPNEQLEIGEKFFQVENA